jgi:hypothetical protein
VRYTPRVLFGRRSFRAPWVASLFAACIGCDELASVAATAGDFAGATADAHCDRRFVGEGGQAVAFCQEVVATVAASQFADDCRTKHRATPGPGLCPRARVIGGCRLLEKHDDDAKVWDWYYDVSDIVADAGTDAGPGGGPTFQDPPRTTNDVSRLCGTRSRYEEGAEFVSP